MKKVSFWCALASVLFTISCNNGKEQALRERFCLRDVLGDENLSLENFETVWLTRKYEVHDDSRVFNSDLHERYMYYELQLVPVRDDSGKLLTVFGTGRDVSEVVGSYLHLQRNAEQLERVNRKMGDYIRNIDFVLENGGVRLINYSPQTHTMVVYSEIGHEQYRLTQTRCLALTDESSKKTARRLLNSMDNLSRTPLKASVKTTIRVKNGHRLCLYISFVPTFDASGSVIEYFGMCRDISEIKATEEQLALETVKAQEVETVKNAVVGFAELFDMEHSSEDEAFFIHEIKENSAHLLRLINDILFLSRLDARMIEFKQEEVDFAAFFGTRCQMAWFNQQQAGVTHMVDNPYERLVVEVDSHNLGIIIDQILANAVEHTASGWIRASYDYTGDSLVMAFQDTGCGISKERQKQIFDRFVSTGGHGTGLGLSICYELARQMGGKITIKSKVDKGTIVWVTIPCKCTEIIRK